jgi:hypothetical protein
MGLMPPHRAAKTPVMATEPASLKTMTAAQRAYESKRAAKAGMSLEKWMDAKRKQQLAEARAREKATEPAVKKKPGLLSRLLERAHKPL